MTAKFVIAKSSDKQFARQALRPLTPATATMAATKITPNFPGAYSGQVDTWEEEIRDQIKLLPAYEGYRPRLALEPRPPDAIEAEAQAVSSRKSVTDRF